MKKKASFSTIPERLSVFIISFEQTKLACDINTKQVGSVMYAHSVLTPLIQFFDLIGYQKDEEKEKEKETKTYISFNKPLIECNDATPEGRY